MAYSLNIGGWSSVFAVPAELVDKHIKLCGENELKLILWVLRNPQKEIDISLVALDTGISAQSAEDAVEYWIQSGIFKHDGGVLTPNSTPLSKEIPKEDTVSRSAPAAAPSPQIVQKKMLRPDGIYIAKRLLESPELSHIFQEAEGLLGRTLSPSLSAVLMNAHDDYSLPPEVITMLISYVVSTGKTSTAYIEALVKNWHDSGIYTMADAERKITELSDKTLAWKKFISATGLSYRSPSKKEEETVFRWVHDMKYSVEMLRLCYERCIDNTGKFALNYMNKIFESWYKAGLSTVQAVEEKEQQYKEINTQQTTFNVSDFDKLNVFDIKD